MPSFATLRPTSVRRWIRLLAAVGLAVAAVVQGGAGPARADDVLLNSAGSSPSTTTSAPV